MPKSYYYSQGSEGAQYTCADSNPPDNRIASFRLPRCPGRMIPGAHGPQTRKFVTLDNTTIRKVHFQRVW
jgi:hypothetical protein